MPLKLLILLDFLELLEREAVIQAAIKTLKPAVFCGFFCVHKKCTGAHLKI